MVQPEYRIYEMNKRLQSRTEDSDNLWWDAFATEFFEDDATLTLSFCLEDGPKRYSLCFAYPKLCSYSAILLWMLLASPKNHKDTQYLYSKLVKLLIRGCGSS
ncbi:PREDICTED: LIM domain-binding protein 2-like isoform X2 [Sturnus vulgaris]|nr:PREDICTED: LIM domain-binding protein 2-like isoform X2 [Sturnus vulgaris]